MSLNDKFRKQNEAAGVRTKVRRRKKSVPMEQMDAGTLFGIWNNDAQERGLNGPSEATRTKAHELWLKSQKEPTPA